MKGTIITLLTLCLVAQSSSAQVDDFLLRCEQNYAQLKSQEFSYVPQKAYSFSKENQQQKFTGFADLIRNQTSFYTAAQQPWNTEIYYQNRKTSPSIAIHNVEFNSSILENNFQLLQTMHPQMYESINLYQGYSITNLQSNACQIALYLPIHFDKKDSAGFHIKAQAGGGNQDLSGFLQYVRFHKKWKYLFNIYGSKLYKWELGRTGVELPWLSWPQIAQIANNPQNNRWSISSDALINTQPQASLGLDNLLHIPARGFNEWNIYLRLEGRQETNLGQTIHNLRGYEYSQSTNSILPSILAFVQKINRSESSPFFSQFNLALAYQHISNQTNKHYQIQDNSFQQHYTENKLSLQARAYKNFNARHILFYGGEFSLAHMNNNSDNQNMHTSFFKHPLPKLTTYISFEKKQSADVSWFIGGKGGLESHSFLHSPFVTQTFSKVRPFFEFNLTWQRHICESSNYALHIFLRNKAPRLHEINPIFNHLYLKPNPQLRNENEVLIESHLYRKFDDIIEVQFNPYFRYSSNTILLQDDFGNPNEKIMLGSKEFYTQSYINYKEISEVGAQLELKYNVTKNILTYAQLNYQNVFTTIDSQMFYPSLPLFGNIGIKLRLQKLFIHAWAHYNGGRSYSDSARSQYIQYYAQPIRSQRIFPSYFDANLCASYAISSKISTQLNIENIFHRYRLDFLSTLPQLGRRIRLELVLTF